MLNNFSPDDKSASATRKSTSKRIANTKRFYSMVDLFAGCGGLSLGFENANFTPVFVNELNKDAIETYLMNRHHELGGLSFAENTSLHCNDAQDLQGKRLEQLASDLSNIPEIDFVEEKNEQIKSGGGSTLDVLAGGPPCQGYSGIGIRRSYAVDRKEIPSNRLYVRMAKIIRRLRPRIFLFENVRGLLNAKWTKDGGEPIWPDVLKEFRRIPGYEVRWSLVYAKDYAVPQNRPRVLLVGIRKDILESCSFLEPGVHTEDAVSCGFLPTGEAGSFPSLEELFSDLIDNSVAEILRSGDFPGRNIRNHSIPERTKNSHTTRPSKTTHLGTARTGAFNRARI